MTRPRLLDLFSGAGGSARGYQLAGFHVTGVDIKPQPRYAGDKFVQADALTFPLDGFDAIHASPPCQFHAGLTNVRGSQDNHANLIPQTRQRLQCAGVPYVIENVMEARAYLRDPVMLCGSAFGLALKRHRLFETTFPLMSPGCAHGAHPKKYRIRQHGREIVTAFCYVFGGGQAGQPVATWREAMGIDWMTVDELSQAIPPAYTEFIGQFLLAQIPGAAAHVGARPTTVTRSSAGVPAPRGDDAAAPVSPVEAEVDRTARVVRPSASALPDDLDQVWQPLLWDRPNRRWHPVTTVNLKGTLL